MAQSEPYLSVIVTCRNDDHGGTLLRRMQTFTNCFLGQCRRHGLSAELLVVEWNPPADRPRLAQALRWPADPGPCRVRFIEVPPEVHARFRHAEALPLFQMIAKNVGLRRARGRFLLCTNIDILFSDELMQFIVGQQLRPGAVYRMDRVDVDTDVPVDAPVPEQLAYCRTHHLRNNARLGIVKLTPDGRPDYGPLLEADGVTLGEGWCGLEHWGPESPHAWATPGAELYVRAPADGTSLLALDLQPGPSMRWRPFALRVTDEAGQVVARGRVDGQRVVLRLPLEPARSRLFRLESEEAPAPLALDPRRLLLRLYRCCWEPAMPAVRAGMGADAFNLGTREVGFVEADDVVPFDRGVRFGRGWFGACRTEGDKHRWAAPDAALVVEPRSGPDRTLVLDLEPGPGVDWEPFVLQVFDEDRKLLARARVADRQEVALALPVPADGGPRVFAFEAVGGGRPTVEDAILDYRLFDARWERGMPGRARPGECLNAAVRYRGWLRDDDVVGPEVGIRFGRHWSDVSAGEEGKHRWARPGAVLVVGPRPAEARALVLDVQPGWGVDWRPFVLEVTDEDDWLVARAPVAGRQEVALALPVSPPGGEPRAFRLRAVGGGRPAPNGDRVDFRLYGCRWLEALPEVPARAAPGEYVNAAVRHRGSLLPDDVADPEAGVRFGGNWREVWRGDEGDHRWASGEALLVVEQPADPDRRLILQVQPGPGVGWKPFVLHILDEDGRLADRVPVVERQEVTLALPGAAGRRAYRLRAVGGGRPAPTGEVLDFRVFDCRWDTPASWEVGLGRVRGHLCRFWPVRKLFGVRRAVWRCLGWGGAALRARRRRTTVLPAPAMEPAMPPAPTLPDRRQRTPPPLHTMACGDFTLMAREHWFELHAYPEWHSYSLHIDSMLCYMAHAAGLKEVILEPPMRVYHIEHGLGSGATPEGIGLLLKRMQDRGIPCIDYRDLLDWAVAMQAAGRPTPFNGEGWGLADEQLPEAVLGAPDSPASRRAA
jgi:hypothetical protein